MSTEQNQCNYFPQFILGASDYANTNANANLGY